MSPAIRATSLIGIVVGIGVFVFIALVTPDDGLDPTSLAQGLGIGAIIAAAPTGALVGGGLPSKVVALGGGMTIAGMATTPGGNLAGLAVAIVGLPLLFAGASREPGLTWRLIGSMLVYAIALAVGIYAALAAGIGTLIALILTAAVAINARWWARTTAPPAEGRS